jgi:DNA-binding NarL/FixJ family response regulator
MQNVLRETFSSRADVEVVGIASGGLSAVSLIRQRQIDLVVIDANLPRAEASELVRWIRKEGQGICCLALVETTQQLSDAAAVGADVTLRSYTLPDRLDMVLGKLNANHKASNG